MSNLCKTETHEGSKVLAKGIESCSAKTTRNCLKYLESKYRRYLELQIEEPEKKSVVHQS